MTGQTLLVPAWLLLVALLLAACMPEMPTEEELAAERAEREEKVLNSCRAVSDVITPDNERCGRFYDRIKAEEKQAAEARAADPVEAEWAALEAEVAAATREISTTELMACEMVLRSRMKDPTSFKVNGRTTKNGGLVDFTATNSFGGPVRNTYMCTAKQMLY